MPDNVTSMAYNVRNGVPWHEKGVPVEGLMTAAECIRKAGLDWGVAKVPLRLADEAGLAVSGIAAVVRTDLKPDDRARVLGFVGDEFQPLQNWDAFAFFDKVVGPGKARYETAGVIEGGRRVWLLAAWGQPVEPVRGDVVQPYLLLANGHDGKLMVHVKYTPVRVVCQNTLARALREASGRHVAFRHDRSLKRRLNDAAELFAIVDGTVKQSAESWMAMARYHLAVSDAERYFRSVFGGVTAAGEEEGDEVEVTDVDDAAQRPVAGLKKASFDNFESKANQALGIGGTLWAAYNAAVWAIDDQRRTTGDRLDDLCLSDGARLKERALNRAENLMRHEPSFA